MFASLTLRRCLFVTMTLAMFVWIGSVQAADGDSKIINQQYPKDIKWTTSPSGSSQAVLVGDPSKPGLYVVLTKWSPHHMSHPHFHPNDRYITVISGTWWVGTGTKWDPNLTTGMPAGSFVTHFGKGVHWDGAKDEEVLLQIVGQGPATSTTVPETK